IPFWSVMTQHFNHATTLWIVVVMAIVQIVVHLKYFLHLDFSKEGKLNTFSFLFTALIIIMVVGLSVWIITAANELMM
ncbi:cytochrome C oxidase subunit IV family protein, partial [Psychrobacter sp. CAL346-MNA-CIBAN-0220]